MSQQAREYLSGGHIPAAAIESTLSTEESRERNWNSIQTCLLRSECYLISWRPSISQLAVSVGFVPVWHEPQHINFFAPMITQKVVNTDIPDLMYGEVGSPVSQFSAFACCSYASSGLPSPGSTHHSTVQHAQKLQGW